MGHQQILLIILVLVLIGMAVAIGLSMVNDNATEANRDAIANDLINLASRAQQYYRRPAALDGGGQSFVGLTADEAGIRKLTEKPVNGNGSYSIIGAGTGHTVEIQGVGTELTADGHYVTLKVISRDESRLDSLVFIY